MWTSSAAFSPREHRGEFPPRMPREAPARPTTAAAGAPSAPQPPTARPRRPPPSPRNELDNEGHCAGEYASAGGHAELTDALIDHAVSAEMVLAPSSRARAPEPDLTHHPDPWRYDGDDLL